MPERQSMSVPNAGDDADAKHNPTDAGGAVAHPVEDGERKAVPPGLLTRVQPGTDPSGSPGRTHRLLLVAVPLAVLGFIYAAYLIATSGTVPRGVIVAGVPIGGMTPADAEQRLRNEIGPRAARPVPVTFGGAPGETGRDERTITAVYADQPARFTTADLENLGELGVIGEFQTSGFATDSGRNIRRAAEQINGTVVAPGETFSLNTATNPRNTAAGYVEAGVIQNGRPARGVGGGVSQVATTLFNAAYFAGMVDVEHQEHSFYISRYPAGREATVSGDDIDVKLRNDGPSAVQIRTEWTPSSVTVRLLGGKRFEVTSSQSSRTNATSPSTVSIPPGEQCSASGGSSGFTITDTRTLREISTGESRTESHTVHYDPAPKVVCGG